MTDSLMSSAIVKEAYINIEAGSDKKSIISSLASSLVDAGKTPEGNLQAIIDGALAREERGSTGIGHGIAIPHCRTDLVDTIMCAFGHCGDGIDFDSLDGEPVHSVFLLITPEDQREQHLELMRNFATQIRKEHFCDFLRNNKDANSLVDLLSEFESN
ncbi:MAG: PTS sugar transporter subunit IIA [Planctomycetes bacterium]|nr:PTS sugar transporter subunit IIA [Planctomycetota bacterium]